MSKSNHGNNLCIKDNVFTEQRLGKFYYSELLNASEKNHVMS